MVANVRAAINRECAFGVPRACVVSKNCGCCCALAKKISNAALNARCLPFSYVSTVVPVESASLLLTSREDPMVYEMTARWPPTQVANQPAAEWAVAFLAHYSTSESSRRLRSQRCRPGVVSNTASRTLARGFF